MWSRCCCTQVPAYNKSIWWLTKGIRSDHLKLYIRLMWWKVFSKTVSYTFWNLMSWSTAWDADIFPGLFRPCADGGSRCSSSKIADMSLSHPTDQYINIRSILCHNYVKLTTGTITKMYSILSTYKSNDTKWKQFYSYHSQLQRLTQHCALNPRALW